MAVKASASVTLSYLIEVQATYRYYKLQSSTAAKPAVPTARPPTGWTDAEPNYTGGSTNTLYTVDCTVFSNGSFLYSAVSKSTSYEAAKEAYNKAVSAEAVAQKALSNTEIVIGTQTGVTGAWTGVASFASLSDGQQIAYWLPYNGSGNATLNLTLSGGGTTGAKNCYYGGTTRLTTHYSAGNVIHLMYRANAVINGNTYTGWWADANYDSNTYDRLRLANSITAKSAITSGRLIVGDATGYCHLAPSVAFDVNKPIMYAGSSISAASTGTNNYLSYPSINLRTTTGNTGWTATAKSTIYLAGILTETTFTTLAEGYLTTSATAAGVTYISLGYMVNTYQMYLYPEHPMYYIQNGVLKSTSQISYEAQEAAIYAQESASNAQNTADQVTAGFRRVVRIDDEGLHVGDNQSNAEALIDSTAFHVVVNGRKYSRFAASYVQFGDYQLRRSADGGLVFKKSANI